MYIHGSVAMQWKESLILVRYQLRSATRSVFRFKSHAVFSLTGLVIGLACVFIISAWTVQEMRYDRFHHRSGDIYMVTTDIRDNAGNVNRFPETPAPLAAELSSQMPQIEQSFHFLYLYGGRTLGTGENSFKEEGVAATPEFFKVLNFRLIAGSARELDDPRSILLSKSLSDKLFTGTDPINRELIYKEEQVLVVKGIYKDCPVNSSLQFDFVIPYESEYGISDQWWQLSDATFIKLFPDADPGQVLSLMREIWRERITDDQFDIGMISVANLRYGADFEFFNAEHGHGDRNKLYMFAGVAMLILILACLNYLNLTSSYTLTREKEIRIRKIHGAGTSAIAGYFILESVLLSILAWILAAVLAFLGLRSFENLINVVISPSYFMACIGFGLIASVILVGLASGFYPALQAGSRVFINRKEMKKPSIILQRNLRQLFVGSQFILSTALTVSGLIIFRQALFMKNYDTGYDPGNVVEFRLDGNSDTLLYRVKDWLKSHPDIENYSLASTSPVQLTVLNTLEQWRWKGLEESAHTSVFNIQADATYLQIFRIPVAAGTFFLPGGTNHNKVVINEKLAALLGFTDPVGESISRGDLTCEITGVVRDFNFQHLSNEIRPLLFLHSDRGRRLFVKIRPGAESVTGEIHNRLSELMGRPVTFSNVEESRDQLYRGESQILAAVLFFTVLCIILSGMGLIGMVGHSTVARTREIAVRKVFGADSRTIMISQYMDIFKMFLPGIFIGCALAWYIMKRWMEGYAHRIGIEAWVFILGPSIILIFALLSVSFQTWNSSRRSPAVSLKHL